jgi:drug/metabolite transporter (DMT)-like permease
MNCKKFIGRLVVVGLIVGLLGVVLLIVGGVLKSEPTSQELIVAGAICFAVGFVGSCMCLERYVYHFIIRRSYHHNIPDVSASASDVPTVSVEYI